MFWVKFKQGFLGISLFSFLLGCGKLPERPALPNFSKSEPELIILGRDLTVRDVKALARALNQKGEFQTLEEWSEKLTEPELEAWVSFLNRWIYQEAQSPEGFVQLLKERVASLGFSQFKNQLEKVFASSASSKEILQGLVKDKDFPNIAQKLAPGLTLAKYGHLVSFSKNEKALEELVALYQNDDSHFELKRLLKNLLDSNALIHLSELIHRWVKEQGESRLADLAKSMVGNTENLKQVLELADLLNRPADKFVSVLQEGLRTNSDIVHTLSQRWDPIFTKSLSQIIQKVLIQPEDGKVLDKKFWLALPRAKESEKPTPEFVRLYSIILSGIQKTSDPRRFEPSVDSGSYRLPLQLNALFLTSFLESLVQRAQSEIEALGEEKFAENFWDLEVKGVDYRFSLVSPENKTQVSKRVAEDLRALGLFSSLSRLEALLKEEDSGKQEYVLELSQESQRVSKSFEEAVGAAHALKPFAEVTPVLMSLVQGVGALDGKQAPSNFLTQMQGFFSHLSVNQWQSLKKTLFEDFKLGKLELEDRALIVGLFQSDPETAEWVNEVLIRLQSLYVLDQSDRPCLGLVSLYRDLLSHMSAQEQAQLGSAISSLSRLGILKVFETEMQNSEGFEKVLKGLSRLNPSELREAREILNQVFGEDDRGESGFEKIWEWASRTLRKQEKKALSNLFWAFSDLNLSFSEKEQKWIAKFSKNGGFQEVSQLLRFSSFRSLLPLAEELKKLSERGVIRESLSFLSRIQNERMQEISRVLYQCDGSGELKKFLDIVIQFLKQEKNHE